jgi:hypothetical protein
MTAWVRSHLPDTVTNRAQLEMSPHPNASRVSAGGRP